MKKVPVYVILPEHKPKVISDLETLVKTKPTVQSIQSTPCKDPIPEFEEYSPHFRQARYSYSEKDSYHPDWTEDRDNKGALVRDEGSKELDKEFQPPPVGSDDQVYEYGRVNHRTKKSKKQVHRKSVPVKYPSKSAPYQQLSSGLPEEQVYIKSVPDQQHYSRSASELQIYSKSVPDQQHYSSAAEVQIYSKSVPDQQHYKSVPEQYKKSVPNQLHYSKPVSDQQHYKLVADQHHRAKPVPGKEYDSSFNNNLRFLPSNFGADGAGLEFSRELEELYAFPPTGSGDNRNSADAYASSYQYRINH